ncbi:MAG: PEGA domain-containing protein [Euryarchaeota archaeon]|nr:PEGA domain-containing protein [Euryarchaeota archaeon]
MKLKKRGEKKASERNVSSAAITSLKRGSFAVAMLILLFAVFVVPLSALPTTTWIPILGSISVSSSPSGATIHLDGFVGPSVTTPYTFANLLIGTHALVLTLDGYEIWSADVPVLAGETSHVHAIMTPTPTTGSISVSSTPSEVPLVLDGLVDQTVTTPYTFANLAIGTHTLELALDGYEGWSTIVQVSAGEISHVHAILTPIPTPPPTKGAIFINSSPSGATIGLDTPDGSFDGPSVTTAYTFTEISPGSSTITLALDGYDGWSTIVWVSAGETSRVHATLTPYHVKINEIMYNLPGLDRNREWIELFNGGPEDINITGWKFFEYFTNAYREFTRGQGSMVIPSGGYAIVAADATTFLNEHPACNCTVVESGFWLSNTGDSITLKDASSAIIDEVSYHNSWGASGNGKTLELNLTGGWEESLVDGGTSCNPNSVTI